MHPGGHDGRHRLVERDWPDTDAVAAVLLTPRDDLLAERLLPPSSATGDIGHQRLADLEVVFVQDDGPFTAYRRTVTRSAGRWRERTAYQFSIPWFGWLFALPVRWHLQRRTPGRRHHRHTAGAGTPDGSPPMLPRSTPWFAPPDRLDRRALTVLGLLGAASMTSAFVNTLFTQTVTFAADEFGVGDTAIGVGGSIVRAGIVLVLPVAVLGDRKGRRPVVMVLAVAAPLVTASGALAPNFELLVASQTLGRPLGLALDFLVAVVAAEEMPRNCRAYAVSILAMASGLGAGVAVMALPLADLGVSGWRLVYGLSLVWLVVAVSIARRLPESQRFERPHEVSPPMPRGRLALLGTTAALTNVFVAPASLFQNRYLDEVRGFSAATIALFTLTTATPAALGLVVGGRLADIHGRRRLIAVALPVTTGLLTLSFAVGGPPMWFAVFLGGIAGGISVPAIAVYRTELFPTGNRSYAAALLTAAALAGGIGGLLGAGSLLDRSWPYGQVMALLALGQVAVVVLVLTRYPETAHRSLEDLNPIDR